ncbi:lecithin retinol acyltransferase a [Betta splendens]|uniref:Lecithin retinol acyltransferase a n=1 Tax=Betta splendens TaxID=158456 RepID=A0A6P7N516_BETSP|nr:lecithin retinol acyltransferase a [Betta splendens]
MQKGPTEAKAHVRRVTGGQSSRQDFVGAFSPRAAAADKRLVPPTHPQTSERQTSATMLQLLTFLVEKLSLLSNFHLLELSWCGAPERDAQRGAPAPFRRGDVLRVPRSIFTHYGIYLGGNKVAHMMPDILPVLTSDRKRISSVITNKRLILGCIYRRATVRVDTLDHFAYGARAEVSREYKKRNGQTFRNEDVARRAEKLVGETPYSLLWNNCEHFVTYCKYGCARSRQTDEFCGGLKSVIRDTRSIIAAGLLGTCSVVYFGAVPWTTLPTILIPFTLWMAG